jgi:hypothetical protein
LCLLPLVYFGHKPINIFGNGGNITFTPPPPPLLRPTPQVPFIWALPMGLMTAELACAMPVDGGFVLWVHRGLGPFWGHVSGILMTLYAAVDCATYPILAASYLGASGLLPDEVQNNHTVRSSFLVIPFCSRMLYMMDC